MRSTFPGIAALCAACMGSAAMAQDGRAGALEALAQRLRALDSDGDNRLSRSEVADVPALRGDVFQRLDADGDGFLDRDEVRAALEARMRGRTRPAGQALASASSPMIIHRDIQYVPAEGDRAGVDPDLLSLDVYVPREQAATVPSGRHADGAAPVPGRRGDQVPGLEGASAEGDAADDSDLASETGAARDEAAGLPVVVMIHGGGWRGGDKANEAVGRMKGAYFTSQGYVFVSVNYRLSPAVQHPAHVRDVAEAIAWVHRNIAGFGGDPGRLFVMGHSAGAHLAALVCTDENRLRDAGMDLSEIDGAVLLDTGAYDIPTAMRVPGAAQSPLGRMYADAFGDGAGQGDASPALHVEAGVGIPPMLVMCSGGRAGAQAAALAFVESLRGAGVAALRVIAPDKDHAGINATIGDPGEAYTPLVMEFLRDPSGVETLSLDEIRHVLPTDR